MSNVSFVAGHGPIPGAGFAGYAGWRDRLGPMGRLTRRPNFAGSSDLVSIARSALVRLQNAADTAQEQCDNRGSFQQAFEWITGTTFTESICAQAAQLQTSHDDIAAKLDDPSTTDQQIIDSLTLINNSVDISDLLALAGSSSVGSIVGNAVLNAPGTAVGMVGSAATQVGAGILGNIPWWVWVGAAGYAAYAMGLFARKRA